jgi:ABC-type uncharacterized transport system permease subunit
MLDSLLHWATWVVYLICGFLYIVNFINRSSKREALASILFVIGIILHFAAIAIKTIEIGYIPFSSIHGAISIFIWFVMVSYLILELTTREKSVGALIIPMSTILLFIPTISSYDTGALPNILKNVWFEIHVASSLFAYASFAISFVTGILYVLLFHKIKAKHLGLFYSRLPSLVVMERMSFLAIATGLVFLTFGIINGFIWASQITQVSFAGDPKVIFSIVNWAVYMLYIHLSQMKSWKGKRLAYLAIIGFIIVLFNFLIIGTFFTHSHKF